MMRFLRYSMERGRKIRAMLLLNGQLVQRSMLVLDLDPLKATVLLGSKKEPVTIPLADILSCDYGRGDHGEDD
ncbi:MAG: hypothetical protein PHI98_00245 [Eubacteriales bacterium]|nr:hypothetical protein [Eubacteriales bacterium]